MRKIFFDDKIIKQHYPKQNINDNLTFTFDADPNPCFVQNNIMIHFTIELYANYILDNGFAAK
jgi:hypothetical protein